MNPQHSRQQRIGAIGASAFDLFVTRELGWIYRPVHQEHDFGIDGYIDIVQDGSLTGASLAVQIKCGDSYLAKQTAGGIRYDGQIKHLNYYANLSSEVVLVVLDEKGESGLWDHFSLSRTLPGKQPDRWWIEIPKHQVLDKDVRQRWIQIAGPTVDHKEALKTEWMIDKATADAKHLIIGIDRASVENCDPSILLMWQERLAKSKDMMLAKRAMTEFWFADWDDDPRELFQISEVRDFFRASVEMKFPWIYWLRSGSPWHGYKLLFACLCSVKPTEQEGGYLLNVNSESLQSWIKTQFDCLNTFTDEHDLGLEVNKEISFNLFDFVKTMHQN